VRDGCEEAEGRGFVRDDCEEAEGRGIVRAGWEEAVGRGFVRDGWEEAVGRGFVRVSVEGKERSPRRRRAAAWISGGAKGKCGGDWRMALR